jgi:hypothetical protein
MGVSRFFKKSGVKVNFSSFNKFAIIFCIVFSGAASAQNTSWVDALTWAHDISEKNPGFKRSVMKLYDTDSRAKCFQVSIDIGIRQRAGAQLPDEWVARAALFNEGSMTYNFESLKNASDKIGFLAESDKANDKYQAIRVSGAVREMATYFGECNALLEKIFADAKMFGY